MGFRRPTTTTKWSAVGGSLDAVQLLVGTVLGHQLIVGANLHESGPIEHDDEIGHPDRRERWETRIVMRPASTPVPRAAAA
jgi:hypothetical protein